MASDGPNRQRTRTVEPEARNTVRIIELPACRMVWSGVSAGSSSTVENERLRQFKDWWSARDALRTDRFFGRDFMWWDDQERGFAWGYAVAGPPDDAGGFDVMDFPGGLYAVATFTDDGVDVGTTYDLIMAWVAGSGCFAADPGRPVLNQAIGTPEAAEAMGYRQQDLYVPITVAYAG